MTILNVYLHFIGIVALFSLLFAEWLLYRPDLSVVEHRRLVTIDLAYGVAATVVLLTGLVRVFVSGTGAGFYFRNPAFHLMGAAFLAAAALSFYPTRNFLRRHRALQADDRSAIDAMTHNRIRKIIHAEFALLFLALLLAVLMARGIGYGWF